MATKDTSSSTAIATSDGVDMTPALRSKVDELRTKLSTLAKNEILNRWEIGQAVAEIEENERKYGEAAVARLAIELGGQITSNVLYSLKTFYERYPNRAYLKKLIGTQFANGGRFTFTHFRHLSTISRKAERRQIEQACIREGISSDAIVQEIQTRLGNAKRSAGGRKPLAPKTPQAGLSQMSKLSEDFVNRAPNWDEAVFARLTEANASDVNETLLQNLEKARDNELTLIDTAEKMTRKLNKAIERVKTLLNNSTRHGKGETVAATDTPRKKKKKKRPAGAVAAADNGHVQDAIRRAKKKKRSSRPAVAV